MQKKFHIKRGDLVFINSGEYKGQQGRGLEVIYDKDKALVEGVNMMLKHTKPNAKSPKGGIIKKEAPIHISNLNLVDPSTGKASRIGRKRDENNKLVRYSKKSGEEVK